jgi:hypothetical protein
MRWAQGTVRGKLSANMKEEIGAEINSDQSAGFRQKAS